MKKSYVRVLSAITALSLISSGFGNSDTYVCAAELTESTQELSDVTSESNVNATEEKNDEQEDIKNNVENDVQNDESESNKTSEKSDETEQKEEEASDKNTKGLENEDAILESKSVDATEKLDDLEKELETEEEEEEEELTEKPRKLKKTSSDVDGVSSATMSKFSSELDFKSAKSYGGVYEDKFEAAAYLIPEDSEEEGAFVAVGYTFGASDDPEWSFAANMEASPKYGHSYNEAIIVRYDDDHAVDWVWESDRAGVSYFLDVDVISDGSIVAVGRVRDYESTRTAMYIVKINPDDPDDYTEYIINSTAGAGYELNGIVTTDDGGFAVTGYTSFLNGFIASKASDEDSFSEKTQIWQNADGEAEDLSKRASSKGYNGCLIKFDKKMNVKFVSFENYGVIEDVADPAYSSAVGKILGVDIDTDGNYITVGCAQLAKGNTNAVISKWDGKTGELISHRMAGTADPLKQDSIDLIDARYLSVAALNDGSYVVTGTATNDATTEEAWKCYGSTDVVVVRYSSDLNDVMYSRNIGTVDGLSGSMTTNNGTQMEGVQATSDGGYVLYGTSNTTLVEQDLINEGFDWCNYGSNDGIIIKLDSGNNVSWCQNYGTTGGDWIYDVIFRENETEATVVGQSSGQYGTPAWEWHGQAASSTNPYDAFVMCTNMYQAAYTEPKATSGLSGVTWANGTYQGEGTGRGGTMVMEVTIENNKIASVDCISHSETTEGGDSSPYGKASTLFSTIVSQQSTDVDAVSGATLSSNGIKTGVEDALAKASAQTTINAIDKIANYTSANISTTGNINNVLAAINYYTSLTEYEREYVTNANTLYSIADIFGFDIEIVMTEEADSDEEEDGIDASLNDTYWSLQSKYYGLINANGLNEHGLTGEGVKIAVVDSGLIGNSADIDYGHILAGWDYVNNVPMNDVDADNNESLTDAEGHGTLVTGIIAAIRDNENGIAGLLSDVDIVPIRIGSGTDEETSKVVACAIVDAVDKYDVDVITTSVSLANTEELKAAVEYATSKGVIVIGASGNSGVADSTEDEYIYPASYDDVISVGAVDSNGNVRANSTKNDQVYVTAPGQQIVSLGLSAKGYRCYVKSGTSYSAPIVAAMAAAAKQTDSSITTAEFKELLKKSSVDKGDEGYDNSYGYGVVDLEAYAQLIAPKKENKLEDDEKATDSTDDKNSEATKTDSSSSESSSTSSNTTSGASTSSNNESSSDSGSDNSNPSSSSSVSNTTDSTALSSASTGNTSSDGGSNSTAAASTNGTSGKKTVKAALKSDNSEDGSVADEEKISDESAPAASVDAKDIDETDTKASQPESASVKNNIALIMVVVIIMMIAAGAGFIYFKKRK